jgi:pimeloyl-ACP methyl ester carboxylesterase
MIGRHLQHFEIVELLGAGGMGEVYRARDTRLGRDVAIKLLPDEFARDDERRERFVREAHMLAALDHPNIAAIHSMETASVEGEDYSFLVMQLAAGEDLSERIAGGPIPVPEVLAIALQIVAALEAAHGRGIVHRDIKPANVRIADDGAVKVLDFGLAKALATAAGTDALTSPTLTAAGALMGTAAYMSPEQARGLDVDTRTDIWSLAVVMWEMLTGSRLFEGKTVTDTLSNMLREEPEWARLPAKTPPAIRRLLRRALQKRSHDRLQHVGDARLELMDGLEEWQSPPQIPVPEGEAAPVDVEERRWTLTTEVCRRLRDEGLDAALIGDHLEYLDNGRESDTLVVYLAGLGAGGSTFRETLAASAYRGIAITLYGFERGRQRRTPLPIGLHLALLREFIEQLQVSVGASRLILVGFSSGADLVLRLLAEGGLDPAKVAGVLAMSPNVSLETCFVSGLLADLPAESPESVFAALRALGSEADSADMWLRQNRYVTELIEKFHADAAPLRQHGADIVAPFREADRYPLADWYRVAKEAGVSVRLVFASAEDEQVPLHQFLLAHIDNRVLGPNFQDSDIATEPDSGHFHLLHRDVIERHLDVLVAEIEAP